MIRCDFMLTPEQYSFLEALEGTKSEHMRRAIDDYIEKVKGTSASGSPSMKGGK